MDTEELLNRAAESVLQRKHYTCNVAKLDPDSCYRSILAGHGQALSSTHWDAETTTNQEALHATCNEALTCIGHENVSVRNNTEVCESM